MDKEKLLKAFEDYIDNITNNIEKKKEEESRFVVDENYITDTKTGYIWERDMSKRGKMNWDDAMKINDNGFVLPSIEDFKTLNINNRDDGLPMINDLKSIGFENVMYLFWSSNEHSLSYYAWVVDFGYGYAFYDKTNTTLVTCVRK